MIPTHESQSVAEPKKTRDTSKKREQILDAALRVFSDAGYDTASMDRIAETAGVSKRTIYNHHPSKRDLYVSLLGRFLDKVSGAKHLRYDPNLSLENQLEQILRAEMVILSDPVWLGFGFTIYQFVLKEPSVGSEVAGRYSGKEKALQDWLQAACEDGRLCIDDREKAGALLWAIHEGTILVPAILFRAVDNDLVEYQLREIIQMFLCRYAPDSGQEA